MKKLYHLPLSISVSFVIIIFTAFPVLRAQDPGFFMDDWQEKSAELPDYKMADKPGGAASVNITVDMDQELNKVPTYIYGNNAVTWGGNMNEHATVMTDINNLNPHVLRWPGGSLSDAYFWNRASNQRPADIPQLILPDISNPWYGVSDDDWQMSTNDYYDLLANTNSTGIIVVNYGYARYGTGPDPVANAAHMVAEWVRYDNGRSKFWEIGNENFGNWEAGYKIDLSQNQDGQPEYISGQLYGQHCKIFIDSMRAAAAETGADIKIGVVAYDAETSWDPVQTVWNEQMMSEVGHLADFLSVHSYFTPWNENSTVSTILNSHHVPADIMSVLVSDMAEAGKPMLPVAFSEWNIFAIGSMQQVSYINGMHSALVLGEFVKNNYGLATRWGLTNGWSNGDDHGMFSRGEEPGVDYYNPRPVFFYMYYFQKYFGDRMMHSSVTGSNHIVAYGSSFTSGEVGIVVINKSSSSETALIEFDNFVPGMKYYYHTLTGGDDNGDFSRKVFLNGHGTDEEGGGPDDYETVKAFAAETAGGIKVNLPPLSVVYLMVDKTPPPSYVSSRIDTNSSIISVQFSAPVILSENPTGFTVLANDIMPLTVTGIKTDSANSFLVHVLLAQEVLPDDELTLSFSGDDIMSVDSNAVQPFSDVTVNNLLSGPVVFGIPGIIDAELFSINNGMVLQPCSDTWEGNNLGNIDPGDWLEYEINVTKTGYYNGRLRIAAASNTGQLVIERPDADIPNLDTVATPVTGGWQEWTSVPAEIILLEGRQRLRLIALTSNFNFNWLALEYNRTIQANVVDAMTNGTGDTIAITFDREMAVPGNDEYSSFSVLADGGAVSISQLTLDNEKKTTLFLILATELSADIENITVSFEAGTLMAADNKPVESFTDVPVLLYP